MVGRPILRAEERNLLVPDDIEIKDVMCGSEASQVRSFASDKLPHGEWYYQELGRYGILVGLRLLREDEIEPSRTKDLVN